MRFIVASYGAKHVGMLLTHLFSIARRDPGATAAIYWQDIAPRQIEALRQAFPRFDFHQTQFDFAHDYYLRISSKVHAWARAMEEHTGEPQLCFADADTLLRRPLHTFFAGSAAEVIFTDKPERTALNTGVLLARGGAEAKAFFARWRDETLSILRDPERFRQANDFTLGYGASDQMALWQMLDYQRGQRDYTLTIDGLNVRVHAEPCTLLNETNSVPLSDAQHLLHYKGGWQPILLEGRAFTSNRPRLASWPMFTLYLREFRAALDALNASAGTDFTAHDFGVVIPSYVEVQTGGFDAARYAVWQAREAGKSALRTLGHAARKLAGVNGGR